MLAATKVNILKFSKMNAIYTKIVLMRMLIFEIML